MPVEDNSVDVVISNCVINLSPDKDAVFREACRVLKRGRETVRVGQGITWGAAPENQEES